MSNFILDRFVELKNAINLDHLQTRISSFQLDSVIDILQENKYWVICHLILLTTLTLWSLSINRSQQKPTTSTSSKPSSTNKMPDQPDVKLAPPQDKPFTLEELSQFDGSDPNKPTYIAIKGIVFDVSNKRDVYGPGGSYHVFAGKDGSKGLGMSSLKVEDAIADYSTLSESELKVLDDWVTFFKKRYTIAGQVTELNDSKRKL